MPEKEHKKSNISTVIGIFVTFFIASGVGVAVYIFSENIKEEVLDEFISREKDGDFFVKIDIYGEGHLLPEKGKHWYKKGEGVNISANPKEGWFLEEWIKINNKNDDERNYEFFSRKEDISIDVKKNYHLKAVFKEKESELKIDINGEGDVEPKSGNIYEYGEEVNLRAVPKEGWVFKKWEECFYNDLELVCDNFYEEEFLIKIGKGFHESIAVFFEKKETMKEDSIDIKIEALGSYSREDGVGKIISDKNIHEYKKGEDVILRALPRAGWSFYGWKICNYSSSEGYKCNNIFEEEISFIKEDGRVEGVLFFKRP